MEIVWEWLNSINKKHPPFDATKWVPLTQRFPDRTVKELWKLVNIGN